MTSGYWNDAVVEKSALADRAGFTYKYDFPSNFARKRRLSDLAALKLGVDILRGVYKPLSRLPTENDGGSLLAMSRANHVEAIGVLISKGLVEGCGKRGVRVCAVDQWDLLDAEVLRWSFMAGPNADFCRSLFERRMAIEPAAAKLAATRRSDDELARLRQALDTMGREALASERGYLAEIAFHTLLIQASHNELLTAMTQTIETFVAWPALFKIHNDRLDRNALADHERVFDAVARHDGEGARWAMQKLLRLAEADIQNR